MANQVTIIKQPLYGTVVWNGIDFIYTPQQGFVGQDLYIYTTTDGITSQTITNYVNTQNNPLSAGNINITSNASDLVNINLQNYVIDDGLLGPYKITKITNPKFGTVGYSGNIIQYKSNGYDALDVFYYTVSDGQYNSTGTITLSIINGNNIEVPQYITDEINIIESNLTYVKNNSGNWQSSYTILCANSAEWNKLNPERYDSVSNVVETNSGNWDLMLSSKTNYDESYSIVSNFSGDWNYTKNNIDFITSIISANSSEWETSYTILCGNSSKWDENSSGLNNLTNLFSSYSADWNNSYNLVNLYSGAWDKSYCLNILSTGSANWNSSYSILSSTSGLWNNNTNVLNSLTSSYVPNSGNWNTAFNTVSILSTNWGDQTALALLTSSSANWNSVAEAKPLYDQSYTVVSANSGDWNYVADNFNSLLNTTSSLSNNWVTSYTILTTNSANWENSSTNFGIVSTNYSTNSANWDSTYNTVCASSAGWNNVISINNTLTANSANWNSSYSVLTTNSANWNSNYSILTTISSTYYSNSANWDSTFNTVSTNSAYWSDTSVYTVVTSKSANWDSVYNSKTLYDNSISILSSNSANWDYVSNNITPTISLVSSNSANWDNSYNVVSTNSAAWNNINTNITSLSSDYSSNSANWTNTYLLVSANSSYWDNTSTIEIINNNYENWNTTYNVVCSNSASWELNKTNLNDLTNNFNLSSNLWNSNYNVVSANSAQWGDATASSILTSNSGKYESTYTTVCANSSNWNNVSSVYIKYDNTYSVLTSNSSNWENTYNTVSTNYQAWNTTTSLITTNSAKWLNGAIDLNFTTNDLIVSGNAIFYGSLTADGATTQLNTSVVATSAFSLNNTRNVDALAVTKTTTSGALANFSNVGGSVLYVDPNNKVGINTSAPNEALTVVGNISATGLVYGQIPPIYTVFQNNSGKYEQTSSYVNLSSVTINQLLTTSKPSYDTAYTYVTGVSTNINNFFTVNKPTYDTAFTTVTSQSGLVNTSYTFLTTNSAKLGIDTTYRSKSANYESAYNWVAANSGSAANTAQINVIFDGNGETINPYSYVIVQIPNKIGIINWALYSDVSNTTSYIEVLSSNYDSYPTFQRISPSSTSDPNFVKITSGYQKAPNVLPTSLTNWITAIDAGSLLKFKLNTNTAASMLTLSLKCVKN